MRKVVILLCLVQLLFTGFAQAKPGKDREYWVKTMIKIIDPLYTNLSQNTLRKNMPVETFDGLNNGNTRKNVMAFLLGYTYLLMARKKDNSVLNILTWW